MEMLGGGSKRTGGRRRTWRFCLGATSATLIGAGAAMLSGVGGAGADSGLTQGSSSAQSMWVGPHEGSLAVGAIFGVALAGNTGASSKAQSEGVDLGAVGASMKSYNCGAPANPQVAGAVPSPLIVESGEPGASQGISQGPSQSDYFSNEFGQASNTPYAEADTTYAGPLADPSNAFTISGMHSKAWSGVVNGVDEAGASSDIGSISLGGGTVVLNGLHWLSVTPVNGGGQQTGTFGISQAIIGGTALPASPDLSQVFTAANQALAPLGIQVNFPTSTVSQGIQFVSPLQIEIVPSSQRDSVVDPVVTGLQPTYYQVANGLENGFSSDQAPYNSLGQLEDNQAGQQISAALCQSDNAITIGDVTIASLDGGGYFSTELGGVNSSAGPLAANQFTLGNLTLGALNPGSLGTPGSLGLPGSTNNLSTTTGGAKAAPTKLPSQAARARLRGFSAGGPLLGAGLGALALLLALAEGDRRLMRRGQKSALAGGPDSGVAAPGGGPEE
ncbi:MAG TPA: hypothetical protein DCQ30_14265 [Acidimicrobiaceae bacterium]|nr:hypothetical protein [Acidimicrobiaceae bacterium]